MEVEDLAGRVDGVAAAVAASAARLGAADLGPGAFGGDVPGRLGELGRALHAAWSAGLAARQREAADTGERLADLVGALRLVAERYRAVEDAADRRHRGVG